MADDVPVSDVLCEAMEYLSKLGSNLRARSDILKEKRIRSDKLKNAHAVQKAANKVLLICELSRKSLENVETGVKKILNLVDASQKQSDSDGGKSSTRRTRDADKKPSSDKKREVHYIHYQSKNLRISKKISMKHYTSVKVLAKKMSMSFIEMYPVYHDCKLYRLRRKQVRKDSDQSSVSSSCEIVNEKEKSRLDKETNQSPDSKRLKPNEEVEDYKDAILSESLNNRCEKEKINPKNDSESDSDQSKISECRRESKHSRSHKDKNDSSDGKEMNENKRSCDTNNENGSCKEQKASKHGKTDSKNESRISKESRERLRKSRKKEKGKERHKSSKEQDSSSDESTVHKSRERHRSMKYSGDSSDNNEKTKLKTSPMKKNISVINSDDSSDNNEKTKLKTSPMKKNISVINLSSDDEESTAVATSTKKEQSYLDESKDINDKKAQQKSASDNEINESNSHKADSSNDESNEKKTDNKPLIKCVSLTKLLKPTVLEKVADRTIKAIRSKERDQEMLKKKLEREEKKKLEKEEIIKLQKEEDEHYWTLKREEVKSFKAKEFKINVVKLPPKFTAEFLNKHSLRRITQKNSILFELEEKELLEKDNGIIKDSDPPIDEIKISLLNDSDSESSPVNNIVFESQNAKNTLLDDSDPDNNGAGDNECISETNDNVETLSVKPSEYAEEEQDNSGLQSGVHEKTPEKELPKATAIDADLAKSSLLESSNPTTPGTLDKKCRKSESVTPSKRKHVMESMNAKKMLLTHSSSSSEDEKIKTKIQHVHKELLKGSSDEETTPKVSRKKTISSDSDEDIELLKRAKKKRKTSNSKHSSSDKEKSGSDSDKNDSHKTESNDEKGNGSDQEGKSVPAPDTQEKVQDGKAAYGDSTADLDADDKQSDSSSSKV